VDFLKSREEFCTAACARFLHRRSGHDKVWYISVTGNAPSALLILSRRSLFPLFDCRRDIPLPPFINRFFRANPIHAIQGLVEDTERLEAAALGLGRITADRFDYDLMVLDDEPNPECLRRGPPGLILRKPEAADTEALFTLQAAYEQEEVIPRGGAFNPAASRLYLEQLLKKEYVLAAELGGRIVGKINTSGEAFTRCQIGGVYVLPGCRGLGIGVRMTAALVRNLRAAGKGVSLFVKKRNHAARAVYRRVGFRAIADYRICYY
jgi:ribosomal protein S18 acetylase RimI-like enzyme